MKAICTDGLVIECGNFKAIEGGVLLTEDVKRNRPMGFVPADRLKYILPEEVAPDDPTDETRPADAADPSSVERGELAAMRDRIDRLEAAVSLFGDGDDPATGEDSGTDDPEAGDSTDGESGSDSEGKRSSHDRRSASEHTSSIRAATSATTSIERGAADGIDEHDRSTSVTEDRTETVERLETTGFDPVAIVAEQAAREDSADTDSMGTDGDGTDSTDPTAIGRSDPVATMAAQRDVTELESDSDDDSASVSESETGGEAAAESSGDDDLQRIDGLGPTYATRLREAGIESSDDLRSAAAETIATAAEVGETRAENWIEAAQES